MAQARILIARRSTQTFSRIATPLFSVEEVSTMEALLDTLGSHHPSVLLLALDFPNLGGPDRIRELRRVSPSTKIVAMSPTTNDDEELEVLRMGGRGYCGPLEAQMILKMIEKVREGEVWAARKTIGALLDEFFEVSPEVPVRDTMEIQRRIEQLTSRERQVLLLLGTGGSNKEIATALGLSVSTVKAHMTRIFRKLGQPDRVHLALYVSALGRAPAELDLKSQ